jgi:hypothetical protein
MQYSIKTYFDDNFEATWERLDKGGGLNLLEENYYRLKKCYLKYVEWRFYSSSLQRNSIIINIEIRLVG